ncbi:hypothetical protein [Spiroplasma endosymbiont of Panzeria rudis]|uniref:hypothetical protein n=1 Tax=Spiroplasma endosymbiont of Panzeria rudis TaxID=3066301 RepID=UPI0030D20AFB
MSVPFNQNLDNTERLVEAPEFIEFFKISNSPWANFFPTERGFLIICVSLFYKVTNLD